MVLSAEVHRLLTSAGPEALEGANQRYRLVEAYQKKQREVYCEWAYEVYDQQTHPALSQSPRAAWENGLDLGGQREHRRIRYDDAFQVLTLPGSPRETALVSRNHGIQFHYLLYWNDVFASPGVVGTKVKLRFDPFDISHVYAYVHNHWVECITPAYYGQLHGHSEREITLVSIDLTTLQVYEEYR
jgi:putative transposase